MQTMFVLRPSGEGLQPISREAAIADEQALRPLRFRLDLRRKDQQVRLPRRDGLPFGLEQEGFLQELEAAVDLLPDKPERSPRAQSVCVKQLGQQALERESSILRFQASKGH